MKLSSTSSRFSLEPSVKLSRSRFKIPVHSHKLTFNNGELIPIKAMEILPGDTVSLDMASVLRMSTPVKPVMDNVFVDFFAFFVPRRLTWQHWEEFMGANKNGPWDQGQVSYNLPQTKSPRKTYSYMNLNGSTPGVWFKLAPFSGGSLTTEETARFNALRDRGVLYYKNGNYGVYVGSTATYDSSKEYYVCYRGWDVGSLAQYMGAPIGTKCEVDSGYFRSYCLIWNEYFRDQNYMNPVNTDFASDSDVQGVSRAEFGSAGSSYVTDAVLGGKPLQVARFHDYFSSVLPEPQFGDSVKILSSALAPVENYDPAPTLVNPPAGTHVFSPTWYKLSDSSQMVDGKPLVTAYGKTRYIPALGSMDFLSAVDVGVSLGADLQSVSPTINDLRTAFQVQKYLERSARYGRRYIEILLGQFGVVNPDYRLQRPELLCWYRKPLQVTQVLQTSSTDSTSPQGNTSAYSLTVDKRSCFTKSFTEHGILLVLMCTRTSRSYQQGLPRQFSRRKKLDFYFPVFAHLGEQPILNKEIFLHVDPVNAQPSYTYPDEVFGYQEAWAEYRYMNSQVSGEFSSLAPQSLDFWHYGDFYLYDVYCSDDWLFETPANLDRTLAVSSSISAQFYCDVAFDVTMVRPMPLYSIPGLADHF